MTQLSDTCENVGYVGSCQNCWVQDGFNVMILRFFSEGFSEQCIEEFSRHTQFRGFCTVKFSEPQPLMNVYLTTTRLQILRTRFFSYFSNTWVILKTNHLYCVIERILTTIILEIAEPREKRCCRIRNTSFSAKICRSNVEKYLYFSLKKLKHP